MSKEQIEEMEKNLTDIFDEEYAKRYLITPQYTAKKLYAKGYRKQSEVAEEIFAEIHQRLDSNIECCKITAILTDSKRAKEDYEIAKRTLIDVRHYIAELKKKYVEAEK